MLDLKKMINSKQIVWIKDFLYCNKITITNLSKALNITRVGATILKDKEHSYITQDKDTGEIIVFKLLYRFNESDLLGNVKLLKDSMMIDESTKEK